MEGLQSSLTDLKAQVEKLTAELARTNEQVTSLKGQARPPLACNCKVAPYCTGPRNLPSFLPRKV